MEGSPEHPQSIPASSADKIRGKALPSSARGLLRISLFDPFIASGKIDHPGPALGAQPAILGQSDPVIVSCQVCTARHLQARRAAKSILVQSIGTSF